ncbi:LacI family transcriptional regulator [Gracilibacillus halotolerans]|uniref:LacI family transcriptional regulator n=1 Tax=Gracilibacillus halotolerans TaxID=74386 RepID=A0A841RKY0_9BACI|nr:LacI family DNA-binding transcriptional regulator [Gracilibacillus halotolerans]MBB6512527.1 LacI family transcriptional regulator [Gracilibacillus halotolerans]
MTVTIKDVAKVANVSYSTVSKALNNSPLVKEATKKKVLKVAKELGYEPNLAAKQLVSKRTEVIGLVWPTIERIVLATLVTNISNAFKQTPYSMILSVDTPETAMETFRKFSVDGIIAFAESDLPLESFANIPVVNYGVYKQGDVSYPTIDANHEKAIELAVDHLHRQGHKHIVYAGLLDTTDPLQIEKVESYRKAMKKFSIENCIHEVDTKGLDWQDGYHAVDKILQSDPIPTAIIGGSYDISGGIVRALQEREISIPEEMSIVSYDNIPQMETMEVPMTCVGVPVNELAKEIVSSIIDLIEEKEEDAWIKKLTPVLTVRESTAFNK